MAITQEMRTPEPIRLRFPLIEVITALSGCDFYGSKELPPHRRHLSSGFGPLKSGIGTVRGDDRGETP
jgi:hypothetical protein